MTLHPAMSSNDPCDARLRDRPKLAEALAKLSEGLSEDDDPFYDGWRHRKRSAQRIDTARRRGIPSIGFPAWARVVTAALIAFSISLVLLRIGFGHRTQPGPPADRSPAAAPSAASAP